MKADSTEINHLVINEVKAVEKDGVFCQNHNLLPLIIPVVNPEKNFLYEPRHDKTNIMGLRPAWIQTSLRIRAA
jgi:hypothetical protein